MSDIHGCLHEMVQSLSLFVDELEHDDTKLIFLGDYVHGPDSRGVLDHIINLQQTYGEEKIIALLGNHEDWVLAGSSSIDSMNDYLSEGSDEDDSKYIFWLKNLPRYYVEGNTIFVHAGIDEEAGEDWEWGTDEYTFTMKYPAQTGKFEGNMKIVAGHVGTSEVAGDPNFHDIYYDGESHYYIDGTVLESRVIPVIMVDTKADKYYRVTESGNYLILPFNEDN